MMLFDFFAVKFFFRYSYMYVYMYVYSGFMLSALSQRNAQLTSTDHDRIFENKSLTNDTNGMANNIDPDETAFARWLFDNVC